MIAAVEKRDFDIDHRIAGKRAVFGRFLNALFDRRNVFPRNRAALDRIDKFKSGAGLLRLEVDPNIAVLAATAGLANETALLFNFLANGFFVGDLRLADVGADIEFAQQAIDDDFEMQARPCRR